MKLLDSFNFIPQPLSALPKTFGITEAKKGDFPHLFNTSANQNYVGEWPAAHFYGVDCKKPEAREEFLQWHAKQSGKTFDFRSMTFLITLGRYSHFST